MENNPLSTKAFTGALVVLFFSIAANNFFVAGNDSIGIRTMQFGVIGPLVLCIIFGILFVVNPDSLSQRLKPVSSNPWTWLGVVSVFWIYLAISSVLAMKSKSQAETLAQETNRIITNDIVPFRLALERWVIPRHLEREQAFAIIEYLEPYAKHAVTIRVDGRDSESRRFADDISGCLRGWTVDWDNSSDNLQSGLRIYRMTTSRSGEPKDDPRNPRGDTLLQNAFRKAGIRINGTGSGPGTNNTIFLDVGPRKRDLEGEHERWPVTRP